MYAISNQPAAKRRQYAAHGVSRGCKNPGGNQPRRGGNPKLRTPICYNAAAAHSLLPRNMKRTELILAGHTQTQTDEAIFAAVDKKELPAMEPGRCAT